MRLRSAALVAAAAILTLLLAAGSCAPPSGPEAGRFPTQEFDLCERIDLNPLDPLSPTVWEEHEREERDWDRDRYVPQPGTCQFAMRMADGHTAELDVMALVEESIADAEVTFEQRTRRTTATAGSVDGVGDQAAAFAGRSSTSDDVRRSEYALVARAENLVVEVDLGVDGDDYPPQETLAELARTIAADTIAAVPPAPLPTPIARRGMAYDTTGVDLCEETDTVPLDALSLTVEIADQREHDEHFPHWIGCGYALAGGGHPTIHDGGLVVDAHAHPTIVAAERDYHSRLEFRASQDRRSPWEAAGNPDGLGDRAAALSRTENLADVDLPDRFHSEYWVIALHGNLVVVVELSAFGDEAIATEELAGVVHPIVVDTIASVPLNPES